MAQLEDQSTRGQSTDRMTALDITRALAIFGMVIVNVGAVGSEGVQALVVTVIHGRAAILFIVLAGIGVTLLTGSLRARRVALWPTILWRASVLLVLGMALQQLPTGVNVILMLYAALFLAALTAERLHDRWLLSAAAVTAVLGPLAYIWSRGPAELSADPASVLQNPLDSAAAVFLTGPYPAVVWIAPFLFGMWLGRLDLRRSAVQRALILGGAAIAVGCSVLSWILIRIFGEPDPEQIGADHLLLASGHSQMPMWVFSAVGTSAVAIGVVLMLAPKLGRAAYPLIVTGQLALTAYCVHLIAIALLVRPETDAPNRGLLSSAIIIALLIGLCLAWRAWASRGPFELLLRIPTFRKRR